MYIFCLEKAHNFFQRKAFTVFGMHISSGGETGDVADDFLNS